MEIRNFFKKNWQNLVLIAVLGVMTYIVVVKRAPINMDEFSHYHPIICNHYENNKLNVFREACGMYDLKLPGMGVYLPLRTFPYSGSLTALIYYPVFLIWQSPDSARMMGFLMVVIQAVILAKLFKQKFAYCLVGLVLLFPYYYQMIIDTGMVQLYTTLTLLACLFIERYFEKQNRKYLFGVAGVLAVLIWSRLVNVFCFPALAFAFVGFAIKYKKVWRSKMKKTIIDMVIAGLIFAVPTLWYLFASGMPNTGRFPVIAQYLGRNSHTVGEMLNPMMYFNHDVMPNFIDPLASTERAFYVQEPGALAIVYCIILYAIPALLIMWGVIKWVLKKEKPDFKTAVYYAAFIITVLVLFRSVDTRHYHHVMVAVPFLVIAWGYSIPILTKQFKKLAIFCAITFVVLNCYYYIVFPTNQVRAEDDPSKIKVNEILQNEYLSQNYFYVVQSWGMYYYQGLYGPKDQSVLYIEDYFTNGREWKLEILKQYPTKYDRKFLFVVNKTKELKATLLPIADNLVECSLTKDLSVWGIWMNTDNSELNICK